MAFCGEKLASPAVVGGAALQDGKAGLEWLRRTLPRLRATLSDAERRQIEDEGLLLWLQEIKDLICDAEDVIDELEYEELWHRVTRHGPSTSSHPPSNEVLEELQKDPWPVPTDQRSSRCTSTALSLAACLLGICVPGSGARIMAFLGGLSTEGPAATAIHKINEIQQRLSIIAKDRKHLIIRDSNDLIDEESMPSRMMQTSSLLKDGEVFGREKAKEEIINYLLTSDDGYSPVAITGMGGLGKTALAQFVYNDRRVEEHFNLKMWICATADFDVVQLTREILVSTDFDINSSHGFGNLDSCQRQLMNKVKGKCFLLVIDNLWDLDHREWQSLRAPLIDGGKGSKILITTRDTEVAKILQARKIVELEGLPFHDCWMLFKAHAFGNGDSGGKPKLEAIGKQIVRKFEGVPLAAAAIGRLLYSNLDESVWMRIAESEIWELEQGQDGVLSVLKLSYEYLPPHLKRCFAYCSLFPKNYNFDKQELVQR